MALGSIIRIDDRTVLVTGQELDFDKGQPDVGNALLHRVEDTLFLVDTGVTTAFREALTRAIDQVGPWRHLVLLTTHGHVDHVGNNDLPDEWAADRGSTVEHYVPARDLAQMVEPTRYWEGTFDRVVGVAPLPAPPALIADSVVSLFQPLRPFGRTTRTFESLPLERFSIGSQRCTGWSFADGAVRVIRSQGHCRGHVVVYFRDCALLHLGDEDNGACGVMQDADQLKLQTALATAAALVEDGSVRHLTDGHDFRVFDRDGAIAHLEGLLDQSTALQTLALDIIDGQDAVHPKTFLVDYTAGMTKLDVGGANPNPMFTAMMALNQLAEIGLNPLNAPDSSWQRTDLVTPAVPAGRPHGLAMIPAAAEMVAWKLRKRDR